MRFKNLLYSLSFLLISFIGLSQNTAIPDPNFEQALISEGYDVGPIDGFVPTANISGEDDLDLSAFTNQISDLTGIEDFTALTILNFENHLISTINLEQNTGLEQLFCNNNLLTSLNVANNTNLEILWCNNNQLTSLDITKNTRIRALDCSFNQITALDVSQNTALFDFVCENNLISSLKLNNNAILNRFECGNNLLTNLDVSLNTNLSFLECEGNQLASLNLSTNTSLINLNCAFNNLTALDLSNNSNLTEIDCSDNNLCSLNLKNGNNNNTTLVDFSSNIDLNCVIVDNLNGNHSTWEPVSFSNYVNSPDGCKAFIPVDSLNDFIGKSYTLPTIVNGNYFTESEANGIPLNPGDVISTSQTIYIFNETACYFNESSFNILITDKDYIIPKYFTPNNDGRHDFWKVLDTNNAIKGISIFNKHGKLLKYLNPSSEGWNGIYNGQLMPTDDYWFKITLNSGEIDSGHFTLKR